LLEDQTDCSSTGSWRSNSSKASYYEGYEKSSYHSNNIDVETDFDDEDEVFYYFILFITKSNYLLLNQISVLSFFKR
jgi:hypothetical protein